MATSQSTSWVPRFLLPSVRDILFICLFWSLLAGPLSNRPLADSDIGWHIRTGELILANHALPRSDPYSSTMQGQRWYAWEWLYDLALAVVHGWGGLNGVVWLCAVLVAAVFTLLLGQLIECGTGLLLAVILTLLAEAASMIHLYARPHIASWLLSLLWFVALERWEREDGPEASGGTKATSWRFWFFPVSMLLWVNLHGGWLFGMVVLGMYAASAWVGSLRSQDTLAAIRAGHRARRLGQAWLAAAGVTLLNPFGWHLHVHVYRYLGDTYLMNRIDEFRSPDFHGWAERCFAVILLLLVITLVVQRRRLPLRHLLVVLISVYAGLYSARNLPVSSMLLVLILGPIAWEGFASVAQRPGAWRVLRETSARISTFSDRMSAQEMELRGHLWPIVTVACFGLVCLHGGWLGSRHLVHSQFDPQKVPVAAVDFLEQESRDEPPVVEPVFSTDSWGGYLIYRMYPTRKVVVDDRHDLYGSDRIRQFVLLTQGAPEWQGILARWRINTVLFPTDSTLANLLREMPQQWRVVYEDGVAVVFERR